MIKIPIEKDQHAKTPLKAIMSKGIHRDINQSIIKRKKMIKNSSQIDDSKRQIIEIDD